MTGGRDSRNLISCAACAKLKIKCDKQVPCSNCLLRKVPCQPRHSRRSVGGSSSVSARRSEQQDKTIRTPSRDGENEADHTRPPTPNFSDPDAASWSRTPFGFFYAGGTSLLQNSNFSSTNTTPPSIDPNTEQLDLVGLGNNFPPPDPGLDLEALLGSPDAFPTNKDSHFFLGADFADIQMTDLDDSPEDIRKSSVNTFGSTASGAGSTAPISRQLTANSSPLHDHDVSLRISHEDLYNRQVLSIMQQSWSHFCCNPGVQTGLSMHAPEVHLRGLIHTLSQQDDWASWRRLQDLSDPLLAKPVVVAPLEAGSILQLQNFVQAVIQRGLSTYNIPKGSSLNITITHDPFRQGNSTPYFTLPPTDVLWLCLQYYTTRVEQYFPSIPTGTLQPNDCLKSESSWTDALDTLLMLAIGSHTCETPSSHHFANGMVTAGRASIFEAFGKDFSLRSDIKAIRCALLITMLAAWSGDDWHMVTATEQIGTFLSMLKTSGMMTQVQLTYSSLRLESDERVAWQVWSTQEQKNRLAHSWILLDLECSIFFGQALGLSVEDLNVAIPAHEDVWCADSSSAWREAMERTRTDHTEHSRPSVREVFRRLAEEEPLTRDGALCSRHLTLLLHPIQSMTSHVRQFLACLTPWESRRKPMVTVARSRMLAALQDIRRLLHQWYALATAELPECVDANRQRASVNLIYYHMISLSTTTYFPTIEEIAKTDAGRGSESRLWLQNAYVDSTEEIFFHCGQVLRLLDTVPALALPMWWPIAIYRVALIMWAASFAEQTNREQRLSRASNARQPVLVINRMLPSHPDLERFCKLQEGVPTLGDANGELWSLHNPAKALRFCIERLKQGQATVLAMGIQDKLEMLACRAEGGVS